MDLYAHVQSRPLFHERPERERERGDGGDREYMSLRAELQVLLEDPANFLNVVMSNSGVWPSQPVFSGMFLGVSIKVLEVGALYLFSFATEKILLYRSVQGCLSLTKRAQRDLEWVISSPNYCQLI